MNFARLSSTAQRIGARILGRDAAGKLLYAWLPATNPEDQAALPDARADYSLEAGPCFTGPVLQRGGDAMGQVTRNDDAIAITLNGLKVTYDPRPGFCSLLVGTTKATATRYIVTAARRSGGTIEVDAIPGAALVS